MRFKMIMEKIIIEIYVEENSNFNVMKAIEESKEFLKIEEGNLSVLTKHGRIYLF